MKTISRLGIWCFDNLGTEGQYLIHSGTTVKTLNNISIIFGFSAFFMVKPKIWTIFGFGNTSILRTEQTLFYLCE